MIPGRFIPLQGSHGLIVGSSGSSPSQSSSFSSDEQAGSEAGGLEPGGLDPGGLEPGSGSHSFSALSSSSGCVGHSGGGLGVVGACVVVVVGAGVVVVVGAGVVVGGGGGSIGSVHSQAHFFQSPSQSSNGP